MVREGYQCAPSLHHRCLCLLAASLRVSLWGQARASWLREARVRPKDQTRPGSDILASCGARTESRAAMGFEDRAQPNCIAADVPPRCWLCASATGHDEGKHAPCV